MTQNNFKKFKNLKILVGTKKVRLAIFLVLLKNNFFSPVF